MITIFNRREVSLTFDVNKLARIRETLSSHDIDYKIKIFNRGGNNFANSSRARIGNFGIHVEYGQEYAVYVKKEDYLQPIGALAGLSSVERTYEVY